MLKKRREAILFGALVIAALVVSVISGIPADQELPSACLGWPLLLHVERVGLVLGLPAAGALIAWRAARGDFPVALGQVKWETVSRSSEIHEERLLRLETFAGFRGGGEVVEGRDDAP